MRARGFSLVERAVFALATIGLVACKPNAARVADTTKDAAAASPSASVAIGPPKPVHPKFDNAFLLANGHVLMPEKDVVHDWDPFGPTPWRKVSLGDAGPAHTFAFAPHGGRRFVVAKADEEENIEYELWDAEALVPLTSLGKFKSDDPHVEFNRDLTRFIVLACEGHMKPMQVCETGVFDLATGKLVHRTKLPAFQGGFIMQAALSPAGTFFAVSGEHVATLAYASENGRQVFTSTDPVQLEVDDEFRSQPIHFAFLDDHRLLTAGQFYGLRVTDLVTGNTKKPKMNGLSGGDRPRVVLSPDGQYMASQFMRSDSTFGVEVVGFAGGNARELPVPRAVCPGACAMNWSGPHEVVFAENSDQAKLQFRLDAAIGKGLTEPYKEPAPFDEFGVHPVWGDFDKYGKTKWHPLDRSAKHPKGALVTPKGVEIDMDSFETSGLNTAIGDRFFIDSVYGVTLFNADGKRADLANPINLGVKMPMP